MGTSSIVIESKDFPEHQHEQDQRVIVTPRLPGKNKKYKVLRLRIYRQFSEVFKSSLLVFMCLAVYKFTGLHALWIQFLDKILSVTH